MSDAPQAPLVRLVDDDADLLAAQVQSLRIAGFTAEPFASAPDALRGLTRDYPGVVLTDVRMPGMDGLELLARLRVLERRIGNAASATISVGPLRLDTRTQEATPDGQSLALSRREYMVLKSLVENVGVIQTREALETRLYGWGEEVASNTIEVHIHHLRKKLPAGFIKTLRGIGYLVPRA